MRCRGSHLSRVWLGVVLILGLAASASAVDVYTHSVHPVATRVDGVAKAGADAIAVDGNGDVLLAFRGEMREGQHQVAVRKHDAQTFGTALSTFWTPVPSDGNDAEPRGFDIDPCSGNMTISMSSGGVHTLTTLDSAGGLVSTYDISPIAEITWTGTNGAVDNDGNFWRVSNGDTMDWAKYADHLDLSDGSVLMSIVDNDHPPIDFTWMVGSVEVDEATGLVYIGDSTGIWRFDPGDIANTAVRIVPGGGGSSPGLFGGYISGVAVKHDKIYAADNGNQRIQIFSKSTGAFIQELSVPAGETMQDLDVDSAGNIYLNSPGVTSDIYHLPYPGATVSNVHRWRLFVDDDGDGVHNEDDLCDDPCTWVAANGCPDGDGDGAANIDDLCPGTPGGTIVAANGCPDTDEDGVADFDDACPADGTIPVDSTGCPMLVTYNHSVHKIHEEAGGLALDSAGDVWVGRYGDPVKLYKYDGRTFKKKDEFGIDTPKEPWSKALHPAGLEINDDGDIIIAVDDACSIYTLTTISDACELISQHNMGDVLDAPTSAISLDQDGNVWWLGVHFGGFLSVRDHMVLIDPCDARVIMRVDLADLGPAGLAWSGQPGSVTVDQDGLVYIADLTRVIRFDPCDIGSTAVIVAGDPNGASGSAPGQIGASPEGWPSLPGLAVGQERLFVVDLPNERVQVFKAATGEFIQELTDASVELLWHVAVDQEGYLFVNDPGTTPNVHLWSPPYCGDPLHIPPTADVNKDCHVNREDLVDMAELWLQCTDPQGDGCQDILQADPRYMAQCWPKSVDGFLNDWVDPCWVDLDLVYDSGSEDFPDKFPNDITSARYTVCWDPCEDKLYSAIVVEDTDHILETAPLNWNTSDRVEIYVQADPNGGSDWGSNASGQYDKAQQYIVGYHIALFPNKTWSVFGHGTYIPGDVEPGDADFTAAGRQSGDTITYELSARAWQWYGGRTVADITSVARELEPGMLVAFDVTADSRWGSAPRPPYEENGDPNWAAYNAEFGMVSNNLDRQKYIYAENFQKWALLDYTGQPLPPSCGDWGYLAADVWPDCYVDLGDVGALYSQWLDCTDLACD